DAVKHVSTRGTAGGVFFPIDRSFTKSGFGTVVTGTLVRGTLRVGQEIVVEPGDVSGRIRRLEAHGNTIEIAQTGQRLACNLSLRDNARLSRGQVILDKPLAPAVNL